MASRPILSWTALRAVMLPNSRVAFVLRTLLAMALALYAAFYLQLSSPGSAAITVIIVSNSSRGGILSKGFWRILGTTTGAIASIVLFACFPQQTLLFLVAFCAWLGLCAFISQLLRHFRAYGAVLSGYTVAVVAAGAIADPGNVLDYALSRLAVVTLGVLSSALVTMVFQPTVTIGIMRANGQTALKDLGRLLVDWNRAETNDQTVQDYVRLSGVIERLDEAVEFAGVEGADIRRHAGSVRRGLAALYASLLSASVARRSLVLLETPSAGAASVDVEVTNVNMHDLALRIDDVLSKIATYDASQSNAAQTLAQHLALVTQEVKTCLEAPNSIAAASCLARIHQELEQLRDAVAPFAAWLGGDRRYHKTTRLSAFKDYRTSGRNAIRSVLATFLAGIFWYVTAWQQGPSCLVIVASICALLSASPSAAAASIEFTKGTMLSILAAFICDFLILPHVTGFPLFFLTLTPFLALGAFASTIPRFNVLSFGFVVLFLTQVGIANQMQYNFAAFANSALSYTLACLINILAFRILLPPNPAGDVRYLMRRLRRASESAIRSAELHRSRQDWLGWLVEQNQGFQRLVQRLGQAQPSTRNQAIADCGALISLTHEAIRLRAIVRALDLPEREAKLVRSALIQIGQLRQPRVGEEIAMEASRRLVALYEAGDRAHPALMRAAGGFKSIVSLLPDVERLLSLEELGLVKLSKKTLPGGSYNV